MLGLDNDKRLAAEADIRAIKALMEIPTPGELRDRTFGPAHPVKVSDVDSMD